MIQIKHKQDCCGCEACVQVCPVQCITFQADTEGFYYPAVETNRCIKCSRCEKVCPILSRDEPHLPEKGYAVQHPDEHIRRQSSSGGMFTLLASAILQEGGVVFGARFDADWQVIHDYTETEQGLSSFRGSKYVQSRIGTTYQKAKQFLKEGRKVLFTGTSCQIAGLKRFLQKEYENLLTIDVICHGVPSPLAWQKFLEESLSHQLYEKENLLSLSFRDKTLGWKNYRTAYTVSIRDKNGEKNTETHSIQYEENFYAQAFINDYSLRPSCYYCPAKSGRAGSDITLGDFWGIDHIAPELNDDKGCSVLIIHNKKKEAWINNLIPLSHAYPIDCITSYNPSLQNPVEAHVNRGFFFSQLRKHPFTETWKRTISTQPWDRIVRHIFRIWKR